MQRSQFVCMLSSAETLIPASWRYETLFHFHPPFSSSIVKDVANLLQLSDDFTERKLEATVGSISCVLHARAAVGEVGRAGSRNASPPSFFILQERMCNLFFLLSQYR